MNNNSKVTEYIDSKEAFAQAIMQHLRALIHQANPEITETIKWRQPCFEHNGLVCAFAAFKKHVNFAFFQGKLLTDNANLFSDSDNNELTSLKFTQLADLPQDQLLVSYIQQAIALNEHKPKKKAPRRDKAELQIPDDLQQALNEYPKAAEIFVAFSYSKQKDYIDWITSAKREATRTKRLTTAIEWISEGKSRNWKYENC